MQASLYQRTLRGTVQYTIEYNGVRGVTKTFTQQTEFFHSFENIPHTQRAISVYYKFPLALTLVIGVCAGFVALTLLNAERRAEQLPVFLWMVGAASVPALFAWFTRKQLVGFSGDGAIFLVHATKPSKAAVNTFLENLTQAKASYLRDMYWQLDFDGSPAEQMRRLLWLREHQAITQQEFEQRKQKLLPDGNQLNRVGFAVK